jgi:hypothetical protein
MVCASGPLKVIHLSRHKWPGGLVEQDSRRLSESCPRSYMKCVSMLKISGNEVYHTIVLIALVKIMMCGKLHCQKSF